MVEQIGITIDLNNTCNLAVKKESKLKKKDIYKPCQNEKSKSPLEIN